MLEPDYLCIQTQLEAFERLPAGAVLEEFEPILFNHMVLALDRYFNHRARGQEGKDGNPLNEVRMLCTAIVDADGRLQADSTIRYDPAKAVLKLKIGDTVAIDAAGFAALSEAFFAEMKNKFT